MCVSHVSVVKSHWFSVLFQFTLSPPRPPPPRAWLFNFPSVSCEEFVFIGNFPPKQKCDYLRINEAIPCVRRARIKKLNVPPNIFFPVSSSNETYHWGKSVILKLSFILCELNSLLCGGSAQIKCTMEARLSYTNRVEVTLNSNSRCNYLCRTSPQ